jgi:phosphatidylserine decarboxylase
MNLAIMALLDTLRLVLAPPHRAGHPFIAAGVAVMAAGLFIGHGVFTLGLAFAVFCLYFFRDPERVPPPRAGLVLAAADGKVVSIVQAAPPAELGMGPALRWRVSTFLSILNVHVNRVPADGTLTRIAYRPGKFFDASLDKASEDNERNALAIRLPDGRQLAAVQIAGLVARRILCDVREGDALRAGDRFGIIRFGSRTDIYLPEGVTPLVFVGQTMVGGETVIARLDGGS